MGEAAARLLGELGAAVHIADIAEPKVACASFTRVDLADPASVAAAAASLAGDRPDRLPVPDRRRAAACAWARSAAC